jgi:hypothetical protein
VLRRQSVAGEIAQLQQQANNLAVQIDNAVSVAVGKLLQTRLDEKLVRIAELEAERDVLAAPRGATVEALAKHLQSVEDLITRMAELEGAERNELRRRLRSALHELIARLEVKAGVHQSELRLTFRDGAALHLVLDGGYDDLYL